MLGVTLELPQVQNRAHRFNVRAGLTLASEKAFVKPCVVCDYGFFLFAWKALLAKDQTADSYHSAEFSKPGLRNIRVRRDRKCK